MPKTHKKFIDKKRDNITTLHLTHDGIVSLDSAESASSDTASAAQNIAPSVRRQELEKCGVYFDDGYDYLQHLKSLEEFRHIVPNARKLEFALHPSEQASRSRVVSESSTSLSIAASSAAKTVSFALPSQRRAKQQDDASVLDPEILEAFNNASTLKAESTEKDEDMNNDGEDVTELADDFIRMAGGPLSGHRGESSLQARGGRTNDGEDEDCDDIWGDESDDLVARPSIAPRKPPSASTDGAIDAQLDQLLERDYADDEEEMPDEEDKSEQHTLDPSDPQLVDTLVEDLGKFFAKKMPQNLAAARVERVKHADSQPKTDSRLLREYGSSASLSAPRASSGHLADSTSCASLASGGGEGVGEASVEEMAAHHPDSAGDKLDPIDEDLRERILEAYLEDAPTAADDEVLDNELQEESPTYSDEEDCESVLSHTSTQQNRPRRISESSAQSAHRPKRSVERAPASSDAKRLSDDDTESTISTLSVRPPGETAEQRRERKAAIRQLRASLDSALKHLQARRQQRKANELAFRRERLVQKQLVSGSQSAIKIV